MPGLQGLDGGHNRSALSGVVIADVDGDAVEPGLEVLSAPEAAQGPIDPQEDVLGRVPGLVPVAQ